MQFQVEMKLIETNVKQKNLTQNSHIQMYTEAFTRGKLDVYKPTGPCIWKKTISETAHA